MFWYCYFFLWVVAGSVFLSVDEIVFVVAGMGLGMAFYNVSFPSLPL